jgi:hypothetical protein
VRRDKGEKLVQVMVESRSYELVDSLGKINLDNLSEEISETGAEQIWWGILSAQARKRSRIAEFNAKQVRARRRRHFRKEATDRGETPGRGLFTNDAIDDAVNLDAEYIKALHDEFDAEEAANVVESAKFTIIRKNENLGHLAGVVAQELAAKREPGAFKRPIDVPPRRVPRTPVR